MKNVRKFLASVMVLSAISAPLLLASCNYKVDKQPASSSPAGKAGNPGSPEGSTAIPDYATVASQVIGPRCVGCHGAAGGVGLEDYASVRDNLSRVQAAVTSGRMPPRGALPANEMNLLLAWIQAGAPETVASAPAPQPAPAPAPTATPATPQLPPLEPTYASIRANIFVPKCLSCHSEFGRAEEIPLDTLQGLLMVEGLINREKPEESELIHAVSRTDNRRMPPVRTGMPPLNQNEIATLVEWIRLGTPE